MVLQRASSEAKGKGKTVPVFNASLSQAKAKAKAKAKATPPMTFLGQAAPRGSVSGSLPSTAKAAGVPARVSDESVPSTAKAAGVPDEVLWDDIFGEDSQDEWTEQPFNVSDNWCLNLDGIHYWRRGNEFWTYIRPARGQNRGLALWEVFEFAHSGNSTELRLIFKALLPEGWNPPPPSGT